MFMTPDEIYELTQYKRYSCQMRWLTLNGIKYAIAYDGKPKVLRAHCEEVFGLKINKEKKRTEPNIKALREHMGIA